MARTENAATAESDVMQSATSRAETKWLAACTKAAEYPLRFRERHRRLGNLLQRESARFDIIIDKQTRQIKLLRQQTSNLLTDYALNSWC